MTEEQWLACRDPAEMYRFIRFRPGLIRSKSGRRKLRLFGVACCRELGPLVCDLRSLAAIEVAERLADGLASREEASLAAEQARQAFEESFEAELKSSKSSSRAIITPAHSAQSAAQLLDGQADNYGGAGLFHPYTDRDAPDYRTYHKRARWQAEVLRCVFGNPFRHAAIEPDWLTPLVTDLAKAAYDNRLSATKLLVPARLAVLADALEEAGCTDDAILSHLRSVGPHVRGCWALDLVLGKE